MKKRIWCGFLGALLLTGIAWADALPRAEPEALGFSSERLAYIDRFYAEKVRHGEMAGVVMLIARHGKIAHFSAVGYADVEKKRELRTDAIFRLYSMTKPVAATALMMLYEEGRFQMQDPLSKYIPEFADLKALRNPEGPLDDTVPLERQPTMHDVLIHAAGFTHGLGTDVFDNQYTQANVFGLDVTLKEMMSKLAKIPLRVQPGTKSIYGVGPDVQARLVEILSGMSFDEFLEKRLFAPLRMKDTGFWVPADKAKRLASVHWSKDGKLTLLDESHGHPEGGVLVQPQSVNSYTVNHKHKGGSFGLVSTAEDYWRFAQMMLNGGELDGARILSPHTVRYMTLDHLSYLTGSADKDKPKALGWGLGFAVVNDPAAIGFLSSEGTYFWGGAASTYFWIDPQKDMVAVFMTQHMEVPAAGRTLEHQIRALVYSALME